MNINLLCTAEVCRNGDDVKPFHQQLALKMELLVLLWRKILFFLA
jgi:hypothetical protein